MTVHYPPKRLLGLFEEQRLTASDLDEGPGGEIQDEVEKDGEERLSVFQQIERALMPRGRGTVFSLSFW